MELDVNDYKLIAAMLVFWFPIGIFLIYLDNKKDK